ncbi:hypothetical protein PILCRDRAFT_287259 [Piloderma croceum F 1598]|uniref:Uncharacterized protein n=1 Tax=Piloderma croceum (strain F 1598) TaxID=765440 RepID=A0A0C3FTL9_PILCF|nr:hypothetical protein PILCRDRAFT_287259 [Piloderma croceum F 1598]
MLNGHQVNIPREITGKIWLPKLGDQNRNQAAFEFQLSGRMQTVLATAAPLLLVVPDDIPPHELSIALRIAHDLNVYHKLDGEIIRSSEAMRRGKENHLSIGNIVVIRDPQSSFNDPSQGIIFLHQHPTYSRANMLFMLGDQSGIERVSRLFPIRTGVTVPDWLVVGANADKVGAGAITGAGVLGREWKWDDGGSWLH